MVWGGVGVYVKCLRRPETSKVKKIDLDIFGLISTLTPLGCLGTYGDPRGIGLTYKRGTPVVFMEVKDPNSLSMGRRESQIVKGGSHQSACKNSRRRTCCQSTVAVIAASLSMSIPAGGSVGPTLCTFAVSGPGVGVGHCRANMAHIRQSRPDSGLGLQVRVIKNFSLSPGPTRSTPALCCV